MSSVEDSEARAKQERNRLIDHFKRVYTIVVGLAITDAVRHLYMASSGASTLALCMFATFIITVVPIFHGGDRSLDLKYLDRPIRAFRERVSYLWDVYMLLMTAMLFVGIAEAIPVASANAGDVLSFYRLMSATLLFDVFILFVDRQKTPKGERGKLAPYWTWMVINLVLGLSCLYIGLGMESAGDPSKLVFRPIGSGFVGPIVFIILVFAIVRTAIDYIAGSFDNFMFP